MKRLLVASLLAVGTWSSLAASISLTGTVRDFPSDGVNFEGKAFIDGQSFGWYRGLVENALVGVTPALTALGRTKINAENFGQWYTKEGNSLALTLTLQEAVEGSGVYEYSNNAFFPIDEKELGNQGRTHNFHFTYCAAAQFVYKPGSHQTFWIRGDDDIWVYFNHQLGIDLGGVHRDISGTADMDTVLAGKPEGTYPLNLFFAERHTERSVLLIKTSLVFVPVAP